MLLEPNLRFQKLKLFLLCPGNASNSLSPACGLDVNSQQSHQCYACLEAGCHVHH